MTKPTKNTIRLRPSSAERWTRCPGSALLENAPADVPDDDGTEYTRDGKRAHFVAELSLAEWKKDRETGRYSRGSRPGSLQNVQVFAKNDDGTPDGFVVTAEQIRHVETYLDEVAKWENYVRKHDGPYYSIMVEKTIGRMYRGQWIGGTADVVIASPCRIVIIDLKYGEGVEVQARDNDQIRIYMRNALSTFGTEKPPIKELIGVIVQPRIHGGRGLVPEWHIDDPAAFGKETDEMIGAAVDAIVGPYESGAPASFVPSPVACQWCKRRAFCPALKEVFTMFQKFAAAVDTAAPLSVQSDEMVSVLSFAPAVKKYVADVEKYATRRALNGVSIPGFKLVEGGRAANRIWKDPDLVSRNLDAKIAAGVLKERDVFDPRSVVSPAAVEKVKKDGFDGRKFVGLFATRGASDLPVVLAPESDTRPAVSRAADDFADLVDAKPEAPAKPAKMKKESRAFDEDPAETETDIEAMKRVYSKGPADKPAKKKKISLDDLGI